jgi:hypothetical protein
MTVKVTPGPASSALSRIRAEQLQQLKINELQRVRAQAVGWRNGLAALLGLMITGNGLPGPAVTSGWVVGDQLGEMGQQVGVAADAVLDQQAIAVQVAHGSVEPGPGSVHHHGGGVADPLGDQHAVRTGGRGCAR